MVKMVMSFCCFSLLVLIVPDYHESRSYISWYIKETHIVASWVKSNKCQIILYMNTRVSCIRNLAWQFQWKKNANLKSTLQWLWYKLCQRVWNSVIKFYMHVHVHEVIRTIILLSFLSNHQSYAGMCRRLLSICPCARCFWQKNWWAPGNPLQCIINCCRSLFFYYYYVFL